MKNFKEILTNVSLEEGNEPPMTKDIFDKINFKPLDAKIASMTGVKVKIKYTLDKSVRGGTMVRVNSPNIVGKCGAFKGVFKEVEIDNFGGNATAGSLWMPIHLSWQHYSGGTNGGALFTAWYDVAKKKWDFRDHL